MEIDLLISDTLTKAIYQRLMSKGVICSFSSKLHCLNIVIPYCYSLLLFKFPRISTHFYELNALGYTCVYFYSVQIEACKCSNSVILWTLSGVENVYRSTVSQLIKNSKNDCII